jgi:hypothetical protein
LPEASADIGSETRDDRRLSLLWLELGGNESNLTGRNYPRPILREQSCRKSGPNFAEMLWDPWFCRKAVCFVQ